MISTSYASVMAVDGSIDSKNDRNWRGIFILSVPTVKEVQALLQTDPSISGGLLEAECFRWYGSAALLCTCLTMIRSMKIKCNIVSATIFRDGRPGRSSSHASIRVR